MDRCYVRSSSLARKFFDDFSEASLMPLEFMGPGQHLAYVQHVLPLLNLFNRSPSLANCCGVVKQLTALIQKDMTVYEQSRAAAEYIQSPFAVCMLDAAGSCSASPQAASFYNKLLEGNSLALDELLYEDIRRRLMANGLQGLTESLPVQLDKHPAVAAATPHPSNLDRLLLPTDATNRSSSSSSYAATGGGSRALAVCPVISQLEARNNSREAAAPAPAGDTAAAAAAAAVDDTPAINDVNTPAAEPPSILKRAAWRRQLARFSSHYLAAILGRDGPGVVVLTGSSIAHTLRGTKRSEPPADTTESESETAAAAAAAPSSTPSSTVLSVSFVGYPGAAAAQEALDGCLKELLTRWFLRHPSPFSDHQGRPLLPLAVAAQHHLLLLLPEPLGPLLPAAINVAPAALAAAVDNGAFQGPAVAAAGVAGAAGGEVAQPQQVKYRDIMFDFDLVLHPSMEALLVSAAAAGDLVVGPAEEPAAVAAATDNSSNAQGSSHNASTILHAAANALNAFAYDGDEVYTLPSAVRALVSGRTLVNPDIAMPVQSISGMSLDGYQTDQSAGRATLFPSGQQCLSFNELLGNPNLLRTVLDHNQHDTQNAATATAAPAASMQQHIGTAADGAGLSSSPGRLTDTDRQRLVQQLRRDYGWTWGLVDRQSAACTDGAHQQQQQQSCEVPAHVSRSVADGWWKGPVMRGSVLYGSIVSGS